jgi:hypothetical protein
MITHEIIKTLGEIGGAKRLCLVSWNGNPAKLDLRIWRTDEEPPKPARGITLTDDEARTLLDALQEYFDTP